MGKSMEKGAIEQFIKKMVGYLLEEQSRLDTELNQGLSLENYDTCLQQKNAAAVALGVIQLIDGNTDTYDAETKIYKSIQGLQHLWGEVQEYSSEKALDKLMGMIGFIAADADMIPQAEMIFSYLCSKKKQNEYPLMGMAYVKLMAGLPEVALSLLRDKALVLNPENELAKAFLAVAYTALKEKQEACALTHEILANNRDQIAMALATHVENYCYPNASKEKKEL